MANYGRLQRLLHISPGAALRSVGVGAIATGNTAGATRTSAFLFNQADLSSLAWLTCLAFQGSNASNRAIGDFMGVLEGMVTRSYQQTIAALLKEYVTI